MREFSSGSYMPGKSLLHRLDARAKFFSFLFLIVAVILTHSVVEYVVITLIWITLITLSGCPLRSVFSSLQQMRWFFILVFLTNAFFFNAENPLLKWWIFTLSQEGIAQGFQVIYRVILILVLSNLLTLTTPPLAITGAIQTMLRPLKLIRLPADDIAMILSDGRDGQHQKGAACQRSKTGQPPSYGACAGDAPACHSDLCCCIPARRRTCAGNGGAWLPKRRVSCAAKT